MSLKNLKIELNSSETTLGLKMNTQTEKNSDFLRAVRNVMEITGKRFFQPWIQPKMLFRMSKYYTEFIKDGSIIKSLVNEVCKYIIRLSTVKHTLNENPS